MRYETARLRLRHLDHQDYADLYEVYADPQAMLDYFYRQFAAPRVIATVDPDNLASRRVLEKAGLSLLESRLDEAGRPTLVYESLNLSR